MSLLSSKLRGVAGGRVAFWCPGCKERHVIRIKGDERPLWSFNGNTEKPTFQPSVLVTWSEPSDVTEEFEDPTKDKKMVCHSFVTDGRIQFLNDSTHALAGQNVDLPDLPESSRC